MHFGENFETAPLTNIAQKVKFTFKDFFSKCVHIYCSAVTTSLLTNRIILKKCLTVTYFSQIL